MISELVIDAGSRDFLRHSGCLRPSTTKVLGGEHCTWSVFRLGPLQILAPAEIAVLGVSRDEELVPNRLEGVLVGKLLCSLPHEEVGWDTAERQRLVALVQDLLGQGDGVFDS